VLHPSIGTQLTKLGELIAALSIKNRLPQIEVAIGDQGAVLIFRVLDPPTAADEAALLAFCQAHGFSAYVQSGGADTVRPLRDAAKLTYALPAEQLQFAFMPSDFTQVNHAINQQMIAQAMDWLNMQPQERALDLFCGLGNFTLPMARRAAHVTGVEGDVALVERARHNAHENGIQNVEFHVANLYGEVLEGHWLQQSYDAVLLDPPRSGALEMMPHIAAIRPKRILYVSCYPGTLARDADLLVNQYGYRLVQAGVMDMFPHTTHLESMALFQRAD
jgi:23S rRNA (uracil1939-C5)-methyltransferase